METLERESLSRLIELANHDFSGKKSIYYHDKTYDGSDIYSSICVMGGGTAGYFTALAMKKKLNIPVTLIESAGIPVIGVGEATTPMIQYFLFNVLGLDVKEFYERTRPTWKLGIRFEWGKPGDYYFNYPFGQSDILSAYLNNNDINCCSLTSILMSNNASFVMKEEKEEETVYSSMSRQLTYALHIDNATFVAYLKEKALELGVNYIDAEIVDATLKPDSNEIDTLIGKDGTTYKYDFYTDCSGFRSFLLGKKLNARYLSYDKSLFTDRAIVSTIPNHNKVKPYTTAETMDNGWCWNIPLRHEDHRGYVFSSAFCSEEKAYDEMLRKNPSMAKDARVVKFRSGRHEEFIKGNVAGIGNSYAFVEPLESTGLHMIIHEVLTLVSSYLQLKNNPVLVDLINKDMNDHWDYLRWFLSIHYRFNKKNDSVFWKTCNQEADISGIQHHISLYKEIGLLSRQTTALTKIIKSDIKDPIFMLEGLDHLLLGQGVMPGGIEKIALENKEGWGDQVETWNRLISYALPLSEDIDVLTKYPHLI